ncbi:MAG: hypothetical protein ABSF23_03015 [Terracidiphilus sp.]
MHRLFPLFLLACAAPLGGQPVSGPGEALTPAQAEALVNEALANEYRAAQDAAQPMRYQLRKTSPRLTTTKDIAETRDGDVARLVAINDKPLGPADEQKEEARLNALLADAGKQRRRKQSENEDTGRVLTVLRALPAAFVYQYAGPVEGPRGKVEKFIFKPNPRFSPVDFETEALPAMTGEIWVDATRERVARLEGHVQRDVDFGWGVLGRLNKGGWIVIEQADVGGGQWRTVHFQMQMSGRVLFKTRVFDTTEDQTKWEPLPAGMDYRKAIAMLRGEQ